jgi:hypothetical protein
MLIILKEQNTVIVVYTELLLLFVHVNHNSMGGFTSPVNKLYDFHR